VFARAIDSICVPLSPGTDRVDRGTARTFLLYLLGSHPQLQRLQDLRRDPHGRGWLAHLRSRQPPLAPATYITRIILLRCVFQQLARSQKLLELAHLLSPQDVPRAPRRLPGPLTAEQDQAIQQELLRRNDLAANVLLLLRRTGMRIGALADLSFDCFHSSAPGQWAIRDYLHEVAAAAGLSVRIVPHQLRHTYATEMLRSGVDLPTVMKRLGHTSADMTMLYLDVTLTDLRREYERALSQPRHLIPTPKMPTTLSRSGAGGVVDSPVYAQHVLELFRRTSSDKPVRRSFDRIANRLSKILSQIRKLTNAEE
jgi:integrase